jgi:hypothetical protein
VSVRLREARSLARLSVARLPLARATHSLLAFACVVMASLAAHATEIGEDEDVASQEQPGPADPNETRTYAVGMDIGRPKRPNPNSYRSAQYLAVELRFGPYHPKVDDEFSSATPYKTIFGDSTRFQLGFEVDWQALRIPHFGSFGPGFGYSYTKSSAPAPLARDPRIMSAEDTSLWIMPMYLAAVLRVDVLAREFNIPIVPYGKAGFAYALWRSDADGDLAHDKNGVAGKGAESGYQLAFGGMFLLNVLHPQAALDMDNATGINAAYVFGEYFTSNINSFGHGMQVGANSWVVGLG